MLHAGALACCCSCHWAMYEPEEQRWQEGIPMEISKTLRKRYYLVEKAKNASIIGEVPLLKQVSNATGSRQQHPSYMWNPCGVPRRTGMPAGRDTVLHCSACSWRNIYAWPLLQA